MKRRASHLEQVEILRWVLGAGIITNWFTAIDGGANRGDWSALMAERFRYVAAFEPTPESLIILRYRFVNDERVAIYPFALMDVPMRVEVLMPRGKRATLSSRYVQASQSGSISAVRIDDMGFRDVGLIKLDLEGAEPLALLGARNTIMCDNPVLIIEFYQEQCGRFGWTDKRTLRLIEGEFGYREVKRSFADRVFVRA